MNESENKEQESINFGELEKEGFFRQKQDGLFFVRISSNSGIVQICQDAIIGQKQAGKQDAHKGRARKHN